MTPIHRAGLAVVAWGSLCLGATIAAEPLSCVVDRSDGPSLKGSIRRLTPAGLELESAAASLPIDTIRGIRVERADGAGQGGVEGPPGRWRARAVLVDGSSIGCDDVGFSAEAAVLVRGSTRIDLPRNSISTVSFSPDDGWAAKLREPGAAAAEGDLVVVGSGEEPEFVECAIVAVDPDHVTVVLEEETIRVKRPKVIGLAWLREMAAPAGGQARASAIVDVVGGRLEARGISIDEGRLSVETVGAGVVRLPSSDLLGIDFGAARRLSLVSSPPVKLEVEPWFGLFRSLDGIKNHFDPRRVIREGGGAGGREALLLRPRTAISWRVPEDGRSVKMTLAESSAVVTVALDGREVYRGSPTSEVVVDAAVDGARRLDVTVDFPQGGPGTGGLSGSEAWLVEPRIER